MVPTPSEPASRPATTEGGTLPPGPVRHRVEQASIPALEALGKIPVWLPFVVLLGLLVGGGFLGGVLGWVLVSLALAFVLWLLYLSWPRLTGVERLMRLTVLLLFVVVAVVQLVPRG